MKNSSFELGAPRGQLGSYIRKSKRGTSVLVVWGLVLPFAALIAADEPEFTDLLINKPFKQYLLSNTLLMEVTGVKIIREKNRGTVLLSVASTVLKDDSAKERLRAEKVCRTKALAALVAEKNGVQVCHVETLNEKTQVVIDEKGEVGTSVSELLQVTKTKVEGITKDIPVIGRWRSNDGNVFYLAIGGHLDENGELVRMDRE